jgi:hypothetical protein
MPGLPTSTPRPNASRMPPPATALLADDTSQEYYASLSAKPIGPGRYDFANFALSGFCEVHGLRVLARRFGGGVVLTTYYLQS